MDPFISCPYNSAHRVPQSRIQAHIVRCQSKHPELSPCPYNATHRLPKSELKCHVLSCPSRKEIFPDDKPLKVKANITAPKFLRHSDYLPESDPNHETWD
ncbi:gametocyte-specific factor 1 like protein [Danaus plexippus plexippus]|uniref:Gametocyte-specific factor 1 like protein n=1 Tax=Danaus plexippus plexippus TaxID=278856 RepID=A0A212FLB7_DANPL|nr:gametocyte-specific factor 1 like protein [Danaus plexippus plexippus]